jgi:hypothetical protein
MPRRFPASPILLAALPLAILAAGCGRELKATAPDPAPTRAGASSAALAAAPAETDAGVPLALGSSWDYRYEFSGVVLDLSGAPIASFSSTNTYEDRIVCGEDSDGRHYDVSRRSWPDPTFAPSWTWYRQDREGLYTLDRFDRPACDNGPVPALRSAVHVSEAPAPTWASVAGARPELAGSAAWRSAWDGLVARAIAVQGLAGGGPVAEGIAPGEIRTLAFPLRPGQRWVIRDEPRFESWVEGPVRFTTLAGTFACWAVRIHGELFSPQDVVRTYWGREGNLGLRGELFAEARDASGNRIGTIIAHQAATLTELHLERP